MTGEDLPYLEVPFLFPLPCPHCNSLTFEPQLASKHGVVRSYKDDHPLTSMSSLGSNNGHSPVRPGDSFEKLQVRTLPWRGRGWGGGTARQWREEKGCAWIQCEPGRDSALLNS